MNVDYTKYGNLGHIKIADVTQGGSIHLTLWKVKDGKAILKWETNGIPAIVALGIDKTLSKPPMQDGNGIYFEITKQDKVYLKDFNFGIEGGVALEQLNNYFKSCLLHESKP